MLEIWVFVSGGAETDDYRDVAKRVIHSVERILYVGLERDVVLRHWDYREEPPDVMPLGEFASTSLRMVDRSGAVIAILGEEIPRVTGKEIRRSITQLTAKKTDKVWVFVDAAKKNDRHRRFVRRLRRTHHVEVIYQEFDDLLDFQEKAFVALTPYVVRSSLAAEDAS